MLGLLSVSVALLLLIITLSISLLVFITMLVIGTMKLRNLILLLTYGLLYLHQQEVIHVQIERYKVLQFIMVLSMSLVVIQIGQHLEMTYVSSTSLLIHGLR